MIPCAARSSPLSLAQIQEVQSELQLYHPYITLQPHLVETHGDKDRNTSLRTLQKTDFFTREVDALVLNNTCRISIHSAKDLPDILPLSLIALTKGKDPSDSLVIRPNETLHTLPLHPKIATSSFHREKNALLLRPDFTFLDLRGTIHERLKLLETHHADGVIIAECALIRLNLTHLNRIRLPGTPTPLQGKLAILAHPHDLEMKTLFSPLHHP